MILRVWTNFPFSGSKGWTNFYHYLNNYPGMFFADVNNINMVDYAISFNHTDSNLNEIIHTGVLKSRRILIMLECEAVLPRMHQKKILDNYGLVISPSKYWAPNVTKEIINYPAIINLDFIHKNFSSKKYTFGIIQSNKYSCIKGEMYTFRRRVIKEFKKRNILLELRGNNWDRSPVNSIIDYYKILRVNLRIEFLKKLIYFPRGVFGVKVSKSVTEKSKDAFLRELKFAIIIENSLDYVSEKLFDCFKSGTVPIYIGPNLEEFGIPSNSVIVAPDNIAGLFDIISNIESYPHHTIIANGKEFLLNGASDWTETKSLSKIAEIIIKRISDEISATKFK